MYNKIRNLIKMALAVLPFISYVCLPAATKRPNITIAVEIPSHVRVQTFGINTSIKSLAFSADDKIIALGTKQKYDPCNYLHIFDISTDKPTQTAHSLIKLSNIPDFITTKSSLVFLASSYASFLTLYDLIDNKFITSKSLSDDFCSKTLHPNMFGINSIAIDQNGSLLAVGTQTAGLYLIKDRKCLAITKEHAVYSVTLSPNDKFVVAAIRNNVKYCNEIIFWDTEKETLSKKVTLNKISPNFFISIAISTDCSMVAIGYSVTGEYVNKIELRDTCTGLLLNDFEMPGNTGYIMAISFNKHGNKIAVGTASGKIIIFTSTKFEKVKMAMACARHPRCGKNSPILGLSSDILQTICSDIIPTSEIWRD